MKIRMQMQRAAAIAAMATLAGVAPAGDGGVVLAAAAQHQHKAPHGGTLVELGEEFAHLEIVFDAKTGVLTAYVLDGEAEHPVRIPQLVIAAEVKANGRTTQVALAPVANVLTGEQVGDASQFARQHDSLKGVAALTGTIKSVTVRGRTFVSLAFTFPPPGYQTVSFSALGGYDYELPDPLDPVAKLKAEQVPAEIKALDGRLVSIRGFMLPIELDPSGVTLFMLNANIDMCYFGAPVRLNDWILVRMKPGTKARFTHMGINVSGRLEVGEEIKNGRVLSLYRMEADSASVVE